MTSALSADVAFDFSFASPTAGHFALAPFGLDPSLLDLPGGRHGRCPSRESSVYSAVSSTVDSTADSVCTRLTTPPRASPPVRHHGPLLLPKIRLQDRDVDDAHQAPAAAGPRRRSRTRLPATAAAAVRSRRSYSASSGGRVSGDASTAAPGQQQQLLCAPDPGGFARRSLSSGPDALSGYGYGYSGSDFASFAATSTSSSSSSRLGVASAGQTTLAGFLTTPNPAASLVRTLAFPIRDPGIKHFWWDVRSVRAWGVWSAAAVLGLPGAAALLTTPVPAPALPAPGMPSRHPETEASLHAIYAAYYLPKLNAALAISSERPLQLSVPARRSDLVFVATAAGDSAAAAAMFGGQPSARFVGLVRSFDRFNTGMRVEGNIKRVEYLRGLAALHHAMREHGCRYGFILTEIELVLVRAGTDPTPVFGHLDVASVQLAAAAPEPDVLGTLEPGCSPSDTPPLTACLALWGLCQLAADVAPPGHAHWRADIGAPADGTRRKIRPRDGWMPLPQLAEKREAKRARGWVWPDDAICRKELGKRGVRYGLV